MMPSIHVVRVRYEAREERLCLLDGTAACEVSAILAGLFQIPGHKRVVGIAGGATNGDVVIPLLAMCRYPDLIFCQETKLGRIFRIVTKEADREGEVLYPISSLTPPPPPGRSDLPPRWELGSASVSLASTSIVLRELLVSSGALTPQQGKAVAELILAEDPVVFAAFRVAGATSVEGGHGSAFDAWPGGAVSGGGGGMWGRGWNREALRILASVLKVVVADRETGRVGRRAERFAAGEKVAMGRAVRGGVLDRGQSSGGKGGEGGEGKWQAVPVVPEGFQADVIALADVALVTSKITKMTYVRALHKAVTLDPDLVRAYHADVERQRCRDGQGIPQATLGAFRDGVAKPPGGGVAPASAGTASAVGGWGVEGISSSFSPALAAAAVHQQFPVSQRGGTGVAGIADGEGRRGSSGGAISNAPLTEEAELRYSLLRQALHWIVEGKVSGGLSARHRAIVEHAIATEHPWVSAIYEECKETGDVRGLVLNLQRLPALLERDRAAAFAADVSQPPPPGEVDPPFWPPQPRQPTLHERQDVRQHQREGMQLAEGAVASMWSESRIISEAPAKRVQETAATPIAPPVQAGPMIGNSRVTGTDGGTNISDGNSKITNVGVDSGTEPATFSRGVMAQLGRVIAGCSKLLRLRGAIGEREARALSVMSRRGSPVLLAAVEAYGANQDLENLFDALKTAAKAELSVSLGLSVSLEAEDVKGRKDSSPPPLRALRHQVFHKQQQQQSQKFLQQQEPRNFDAIEARVVHVEEDSSGHLEKSSDHHLKSTVATGVGAGADANANAQANTAGNALSTGIPTGANGEEGGKEMSDCDTFETLNAAQCWIGPNTDSSYVRSGFGGDRYCCPVDAGLSPASADAANAKGDDGDRGEIEPREDEVEMGDASPVPCLETSRESTMRRSASGARAQELVAARFAGMKSAAEARAKASGAAASTGAADGAGEEPGGDKTLRQDVSRLIGVMDKNGMLTDRQRVYLLAQVGRHITERAREYHTRYRESGDSKELYAVLMALSAPTSSPRDGEEGSSDYDDNEKEMIDKEG